MLEKISRSGASAFRAAPCSESQGYRHDSPGLPGPDRRYRLYPGNILHMAQTLPGRVQGTQFAINTPRTCCEPSTAARFDRCSPSAHKKAPPERSGRGFFTGAESGVPGPVRTANLPLRRGMLYPIELLGQMTATGPGARRRTACMLTAEVGFVMSSVGFLRVGLSLFCRAPSEPVKPGDQPPSCKMHSLKMPALQIATLRAIKVDLRH